MSIINVLEVDLVGLVQFLQTDQVVLIKIGLSKWNNFSFGIHLFKPFRLIWSDDKVIVELVKRSSI